jgi:uncharacterized delta-60 repeat protein
MGTLYAIGGSTLYTINATNGAVISTIGNTGLTGITSMTFNPVDGKLYAISNNAHNLYTLNLSTAAPTLVGALGTTDGFDDLGCNAAGGLYGFQNFASPTGDLYSINTSTGHATDISTPPTEQGQEGCDFDSKGVFWYKDGSKFLYTVQLTPSIVYTLVSSNFSVSTTQNVLKFGDNDVMYGIGTANTLITYAFNPDKTQLVVTTLGTFGASSVTALAFQFAYPRTTTEILTPTTANHWAYSNANDTLFTAVNFNDLGPGDISGTLANSSTFNISSPTQPNPLQWHGVSGRVTATAYEAPSAPTSPAVTRSGGNNVLTWTAPIGANNGFYVYSSDTSGNETFLATSAGSPYNDTTGLSYYYQVAGVNGPLPGTRSIEQFQNNGASGAGSNNVGRWADIAIQSDDKYVVVGQSQGINPHIVMARYNSDSSIDTGFGTGGFVTLTESYNTFGLNVAIQTDGKILISGIDSSASAHVILARYTTTGALDATFGSGGITVTLTSTFGGNLGSADPNIRAPIALDTGGNIYLAVPSFQSAAFHIILARYTSAGVLDTTFNGTGFVVSIAGYPYAIKIQPSDGKILVGGSDNSSPNKQILLARYLTTGALDVSLATAINYGPAVADARIRRIDIDSGNNIVVVCLGSTTNNRFAMVRYTSAVALDGTFGTGGLATHDFGGGTNHYSEAYSVIAITSGPNAGKYLAVGGETNVGGGSSVPLNIALARFTSTGTLDSTITFFYAGVTDEALAAALQSTGEIVQAGFYNTTIGNGLSSLISPSF